MTLDKSAADTLSLGASHAKSIAPLMHDILEMLGEDPSRAGLRDTPDRVEASLRWLTRGYGQSLADVVGDAIGTLGARFWVVVKFDPRTYGRDGRTTQTLPLVLCHNK